MSTNKAEEQSVPAWSAFHELTASKDEWPMNVGYLPPITDTPTKWSVCQEIIKRTITTKWSVRLN